VKAADYRVYNDLGMVKMKLGKTDSSAILFDQAFRHWPNPPLDQELKFYIACHTQGTGTLDDRWIKQNKVAIETGTPTQTR